jgi:hypothetical protein
LCCHARRKIIWHAPRITVGARPEAYAGVIWGWTQVLEDVLTSDILCLGDRHRLRAPFRTFGTTVMIAVPGNRHRERRIGVAPDMAIKQIRID